MTQLLPQKPVFSIEEVMEILGISRDTLEQELRSGRLPCKRLGKRRIVIPYSALLKFLESFDPYQEEVKDVVGW